VTLTVSILSLISPGYASDEEEERLKEIQAKSSLENTPDDRVGIPQYRLSTSELPGFDAFDINGQVKNDRDEELFGTQITASFFDENGQFLGSELTYTSVDPLKPGQIVPFKISLFSDISTIPINEIGSIKFRIGWTNNMMSTDESSSSSSSSSSSASLPALPVSPPPAAPVP
jgi:hypothetical protein